MTMHRRPRPAKRERVRRRHVVTRRAHFQPGQLWRAWPDRAQYPHAVVEVRLCTTRRRMAESILQQGCTPPPGAAHVTRGCVQAYRRRAGRASAPAPILLYGRVVARMWLCVYDVRTIPTELVSHECAHAAMAWARWRGVDLSTMPGEEVMAHALGRLVNQVSHICRVAGVYA